MSETTSELPNLSQSEPENIAWQDNDPVEIVKQVLEQGIIKPGDKVLDIGCGFGRNANFLAKNGVDTVAININQQELEVARKKADAAGLKNVQYVLADAKRLPFSDLTFDTVMDLGCSHMLDENGQIEAVQEMERTVKSRGYIVYFGFSKEHPAFKLNPSSAKYRDLSDVEEIFSERFEIVSSQESRWKPKETEHANFPEHVGLNILMRKKYFK